MSDLGHAHHVEEEMLLLKDQSAHPIIVSAQEGEHLNCSKVSAHHEHDSS